MGEVPGVHYLLDSAPVLSNLWPDLDSYPVEQMAQELAGCDSHPLVVVRKGANVPAGSPKEEKEKLLAAFLEREAYETVWDGDFWRLFVAR